MIKLVYIVRRRSDVPEKEFHRYWLEEHGPLVRKFAKSLRARKYVQSHTVAPDMNARLAQARQLAGGADGITEVWWESIEDMNAAFATPAGQEAGRALAEDEAKFIDFSRSSIFLTEEHTIFDYSENAPA